MNSTVSDGSDTIEVNELLYKGLEQILDEDLAGGLAQFNEVLENDEDNEIALIYKARTFTRMGRHQEALETWSKLIELDNESFYLHANKAHSLMLLEKEEEAIEYLKSLLKKFGNDKYLLDSLQNAAHNLGKYSETVIEISDTILKEGFKFTVDNFSNLAWAYNYIPDYNKAKEVINEGLQKFPKAVNLIDAIARVCLEMKEFKESIDWYDKLIALQPKEAEFWFSRAIALKENNQIEKAIDSWIIGTSIEPGWKHHHENSRYEKAQLELKENQRLKEFLK